MKLVVTTRELRQVVDITNKINDLFKDSKTNSGICHLFLTHTTAALTTADLDPGTDLDLIDAIDEIIPKLKYRHPHNPAHTQDHIASSLIGTDLSIPFDNKKLILGTWQRVVLVEFNGPKERKIMITVI